MPTPTTVQVPVAEVRRGDQFHGATVTKIKSLVANVEVHTEASDNGGRKPHRINRDTVVTVVRLVPTKAEERQALQDRLDEAVTTIRRRVDRASEVEESIKQEIAGSNNLLYTLPWKVEGWLQDLQQAKWMRFLADKLDDEPDTEVPAIVMKFVEQVKKGMLQWSPGRSTSVVHNIADDMDFMARRNLVDDGLGSMEFSSIKFYSDKLAAFDAENAS